MNDDNIFSPGDDHGPRASGGATTTPVEQEAVIRRAFQLFADNIGTLLPVVGVMVVLQLLATGMGMAMGVWQAMDEDMVWVANTINYSASFVITLVQLFFQLGLTKMLLALDRGQEASTEMVFEQTAIYPRAFVVFIGLFLAVFVGILMCIVPGVFAALVLAFSMVLVVDTDLGVADVFTRSFELTEGYRAFLFVQALILICLSIALYCVTCGLLAPLAPVFQVVLSVVTYNAVLAEKGV